MSRSRVSLRFWAAMAASCGGATEVARPTAEPETDLVVGKSEAPPIEVSDLDASVVDGGPKRRKPLCAVDQFPLAQCLDLKANECPPSPPPTRALRSPFGGRTRARLDPEWTATAYKGTCCYDWCETIAIAAGTMASAPCQPGQGKRVECFSAPEKGTTAPAAAPHDRCPVAVVFSELSNMPGAFEGRFDPPRTAVQAAVQAERDGGAPPCCYEVCGPRTTQVIKGRAARHDGRAIVATPIDDRSWSDAPPVHGLTLEDAFYEHASIASFARLSLSLLAFGAPPDLVADAHRAALDEIRHAQIAFASAGGAVGPGPCPAFAELRAHRTLADLAEETYLDGCIGETKASLELRDMAPAMADEEARHADLAWRIVEWALASGDPAVRKKIERASRAVSSTDVVIASCTEVLLS
jgi:hypothetical protein